jgi:hypothetical protein
MEKNYQTENTKELYGFDEGEYEDYYAQNDNYLPHFCDVPPYIFIKEVPDSMRREMNDLRSRLRWLELNEKTQEGTEERKELIAYLDRLESRFEVAVEAKRLSLKRRESFFEETKMLYAECICFSEGYAVYLDDDGVLSVVGMDDSIRVGEVRYFDAYQFYELSPTEQKRVLNDVEALPFYWCSYHGVGEYFGML